MRWDDEFWNWLASFIWEYDIFEVETKRTLLQYTNKVRQKPQRENGIARRARLQSMYRKHIRRLKRMNSVSFFTACNLLLIIPNYHL